MTSLNLSLSNSSKKNKKMHVREDVEEEWRYFMKNNGVQLGFRSFAWMNGEQSDSVS